MSQRAAPHMNPRNLPVTGIYTRILVFALFAAAGTPTLAQPPAYTDMTRLSPYVPDVKVIAEEIRGLSQLPFHAPARGIFALCHGMFLDVGIGPKDLARKIGLSQTEVIAAAEARLRSARLYRDAGDQALSISVNLGEDVFSVEVALKRAVRDLGYSVGGVMTVWKTGHIGSYSSSEIILSALSRSLDSFLASYLRINDVACKLPPRAFDPFAPKEKNEGNGSS